MPARIAPAKPPFTPEVQTLLDKIVPKGNQPFAIFTTLARDPRLFRRVTSSGLLGKSHLTLRQREIIIDRVTAQCGSEYEWGVHVALFKEEIGLTEDQITSLVHGLPSDSCWSDDETLLIELCDALHNSCDIDDALWQRLATKFHDEALMEMLVLAGLYRSGSYLTRVLRLPLEDFAARFPTRSQTPS